MAVAARVRKPLQQHKTGTLGPARTVGRRRERLAPAVGGQTLLTGELHERRRRRHHRHTARERHRALTAAHRLRRQVQRHQRRRARRVDRDRRTLQAQRVGDTARDDTARRPDPDVPLGALRRLAELGAVVVVHHAREDTDARAAQPRRVDLGPLERLPRRLQQQPLLRIRGERLTRRDPEEPRVELTGVVKEPALTNVRRTGVGRVRVVQLLQVPATVVGERGHRVHPVRHQLPQLLRRGDPARQPHTHADDGDGLVVVPGTGRHELRRGAAVADQLRPQETGDRGRGGVVEGERGRQPQTGRLGETVPQLHGVHGGETERLEGAFRADRARPVQLGGPGRLGPHQLKEHSHPAVLGQRGEPLAQRRGAGVVGLGGARRRVDQIVEEGRHGVAVQRGRVQLHREQAGRRGELGGVEHGETRTGRQRADPRRDALGDRRRRQLPRPVRQRLRRQPARDAVLGEGLHERVGGGLGRVAGDAEQRVGGRQQHERGRLRGPGQLVQVQRALDGGAQRRPRPEVLRVGRVDDRADRPLGMTEDPGERGPVGEVADVYGDGGAERLEFTAQRVSGLSAAADQQQMTGLVRGDQMPGDGAAARTVGAGHDGGGLRVDERTRRVLDGRGDPGEPGLKYETVPDGEPVLAGSDRREQRGGDGAARAVLGGEPGVEVDERDPTRMTGLQRTGVPPGGGLRQVGRVGPGPGRDGPPHHDHQPRPGHAFVREPRLDGLGKLPHDLLGGIGDGGFACSGTGRTGLAAGGGGTGTGAEGLVRRALTGRTGTAPGARNLAGSTGRTGNGLVSTGLRSRTSRSSCTCRTGRSRTGTAPSGLVRPGTVRTGRTGRTGTGTGTGRSALRRAHALRRRRRVCQRQDRDRRERRARGDRGADGRQVGVRLGPQARRRERGRVRAGDRPAGGGRGRGRDGRQRDPVLPQQCLEVAAAGRPQAARAVEEREAGDLAGLGPGHLLDLVQLLGDLVVGEFLAARREQRLRVEALLRRDDERDRHLAEDVVRLADDRAVGDARHPPQHVLDLARVDVLPTPDDHFLDAAGDGEVPGAVTAGQVTGAVPAVAQRGRRLLGLVVVAGHHVGAGDPDLALLVRTDLRTRLRVHEADVESGHRQTAGALDPGAGRPVDGDGTACLRRSVRVEQRRAERLLERLPQRRRGDRATDQAHAQRGRAEAALTGGPHQVVVHRRHTAEERRVVLGQAPQDLLRRKAVDDPRRRADRRHGEHAEDVRQAVEQGQRPQHPVLGGEPRHGRVAGGHGPQAVALGGEHSLGLAGGAGGVEEPGDVVQAQVVPGGQRGLGGGEPLVRDAVRGHRALVVDHDDPELKPAALQERADLRQMGGVGDQQPRAAVGEQIGQLRLGGTGVERHADRARPRDGEITLHRLHAVAQQDRGPVARLQPQLGEMAGQPARTGLQFGVSDAPPTVTECRLVPEGKRM